MAEKKDLPSALILGTGEYVSGYVGGTSSTSDKKVGVVALVLFDLRRRGFLGRIALAGTDGTKFPGIREHFKKNIAEVYREMDVGFDSFPADDKRDPKAYLAALDSLKPGDFVYIFTPDDLHFEMIKQSVTRGLHVMVTKPAVKTLEEHLELLKLIEEKKVLVSIEVHKRWDPMYSDAQQKIKGFGDFSYFNSYMSQPKSQLITFKGWAGKSSDISYYLNSHHVDLHCWMLQGIARPVSVTALGSTGIAKGEPFEINTEDTITLMVKWENLKSKNIGVAIYTASWVAPKSDVHSQQRFHYMGHSGEVQIDQAHRGYVCATDSQPYSSVNPIYMKYTPDAMGYFSGQFGYGYRSIEEFTSAASVLRSGKEKDPHIFDTSLATLYSSVPSTAILHAGRISLDTNNETVTFQFEKNPESPVSMVWPSKTK